MAWVAPSTKSTGLLITAAIWNEQVVGNMTFLGASHNHSGDAGDGGTIAAIPSGIILIFDAACPTGWTRVSAFDSNFIRGAAAYGATSGGTGHVHSYQAHTHTHTHSGGYAIAGAAGTVNVDTGSGSSAPKGLDGHTHVYGPSAVDAGSASQAMGSSEGPNTDLPSYINVIFCKKD